MPLVDAEKLNMAIDGLLADLPEQVGREWFQAAVSGLATVVGADLAMVGRLVDDRSAVQTLAFCENRKIQPNFTYELAGTPCAEVVEGSPCLYADGVADEFPEDTMLREMSIAGYVGMPIVSAQQEVLGIINALFRTPIKNPDSTLAAFERFTSKISSVISAELATGWVDTPTRKGL